MLTYRDAGVDIAKADRLLHGLKAAITSTHGPEVLPDLGQFAALYRVPKLRDPVLVSSTDGAGTKLKLAQLAGRHQGIGIDVVAMNVNDVLVVGARPLFFLDYIAMGALSGPVYTALVRGVAQGCRQAGCSLIGGETAEMPGAYRDGEYDIAGFCVGIVERRKLIDGSGVRAGDAVLGLASAGIHANGFSLVRKALGDEDLKRSARSLLTPTRIYVKAVQAILARVRLASLAHVTGGGLARRLPSLVAKRPELVVDWAPGRWPVPPIFRRVQAAGGIHDDEMYRTFNMGVGMAVTCRPAAAPTVMHIAKRFSIPAWSIGTVRRKES